jgi:hypothetical protein
MAAIDVQTTLIDRAWALIEARAALTEAFKERNRIKFPATVKQPFKTTWQDGDFPELTIGIPTLTDSWFTIEERFTYSPTFNTATQPWTEDVTLAMNLDVVHRDLNLTAANALTSELLTALRLGGPALGITAFRVQRVGPAIARNRIATGRAMEYATTNGTPRWTTQITLPVLVRFKGGALIT